MVLPWPHTPVIHESPARSLSEARRAQSAHFVATQRACARGDRDACLSLAELYIHGRGVDADLFAARALLAPLCAAQHEPACITHAGLDLRSRVLSTAMSARLLVESRCTQGRDEWCELYADALSLGFGGPIQRTLVEPALRAACSREHPRACGALALWLIEHDGSTREERLSLATSACARGSARGCIALALLDRDERAGLQQLEQQCERGESRACSLAAQRWSEADRARADRLFREGCLFSRGWSSGCGAWVLGARNTRVDRDASLGLLLRSCEIERDPRACDQYVRRAITLDRRSTIEPIEAWLAPLCRDGALDVCVSLAAWPQSDRSASAEQTLREGCDRGDAFACGALGVRLLERGDDAQALIVLSSSCAQRDRRSCRVLAERAIGEAMMRGERLGALREPPEERAIRLRAALRGCALGDPSCCSIALASTRSPAESRAIDRMACGAGVVGRCDR